MELNFLIALYKSQKDIFVSESTLKYCFRISSFLNNGS